MTARPTLQPLLVAFADFTGYSKHAATLSPSDLFSLFSDFAEFAAKRVESSGGHFIKMMGDAILVVFPEERAGAGVMCLARLKAESEEWMAKRGYKTRMVVKVHFGEAVLGPFGADGRLDAYGAAINTAATLESRNFAMSAQAFRKLGPTERKAFKKHTPPITYIPVDDRHS